MTLGQWYFVQTVLRGFTGCLWHLLVIHTTCEFTSFCQHDLPHAVPSCIDNLSQFTVLQTEDIRLFSDFHMLVHSANSTISLDKNGGFFDSKKPTEQ